MTTTWVQYELEVEHPDYASWDIRVQEVLSYIWSHNTTLDEVRRSIEYHQTRAQLANKTHGVDPTKFIYKVVEVTSVITRRGIQL